MRRRGWDGWTQGACTTSRRGRDGGLRTLGDVLALPSAEVTRRLGVVPFETLPRHPHVNVDAPRAD